MERIIPPSRNLLLRKHFKFHYEFSTVIKSKKLQVKSAGKGRNNNRKKIYKIGQVSKRFLIWYIPDKSSTEKKL